MGVADGSENESDRAGDFIELLGFDRPNGAVEGAFTIEIGPQHFNPYGVVHGGVIYTLADTSMGAVLGQQLAAEERTATIEIKINYLAAVRDGTIRAETTLVNRGRRVAVLESDVFNDDRLVAKALGSFAIFEVR